MWHDLYPTTATTSNLRMILDSSEKIRNFGNNVPPRNGWWPVVEHTLHATEELPSSLRHAP